MERTLDYTKKINFEANCPTCSEKLVGKRYHINSASILSVISIGLVLLFAVGFRLVWTLHSILPYMNH
ncbi:MAG TPA: hypothetical protein DDW50_20455 [Firmicutes bacterium]|jgi:hypothetical protein|nr:hypothetical protein [Bacillota bacterium]